MGGSSESLSGTWTGVYDYPTEFHGHDLEATPFNAHITEIEGMITGEIDEPNTLSKAAGVGMLFSKIEGQRIGQRAHFIKTYERLPETGHEISYEGTANEDFTRIEGMWTTIEGSLSWSGPFVMDRKSGKAEIRSVERKEEIVIKK